MSGFYIILLSYFISKLVMKILIINGPNLSKIGIREPEIYGNISFDNYFAELAKFFNDYSLLYFQSNSEHDIVSEILNKSNEVDGIVLNAGAYTHTSVAIRDAVASVKTNVVLVHISNVYAREKFRNCNIIAPVCKGIITGFGLESYRLAIYSFI